jgi:hypothetical protein
MNETKNVFLKNIDDVVDRLISELSFNQNQKCIEHQCPQQTVDKKRNNDKVSRKKLPWIPCHSNDGEV